MPVASENGRAPTVSAVITSFDRPEFLVEAIESAFSQTYPLHEVIVVDDCSPQPMEDILRPFASRIIFERLERNSGANVARNRGLSIATGDYIAFLDDDDIWHADKTERQLAALGPNAEACLCGFRDAERGRPKILDIAVVDEQLLRGGNDICGTSGLLVQRAAIDAVRFDPALKSGQDWDVFVRLCLRRPLAYVAAPLFSYRHGGHLGLTTVAARRTPAQLDEAAAVLRKHREWLGERAFRRRLAAMLLKYIGQRRNKLEFMTYAVRRAGTLAVASHFLGKLSRFRRPAPSRPQ